MEEGILLLVVTGAMVWLCFWSITDRGKPSKYWWPFDMPVHGQGKEAPKDAPPVDPSNWRNRRQGGKARDNGRTWRRSGS